MFCPDPELRRSARRAAVFGPRRIMQTFAATLRQQLLVVQVVFELFSGAGGFSKAAANLGELVISIDIQFGFDTNDLSHRPLQLLVCGWIQAGYVKCVLAGFSCGPFPVHAIYRGDPLLCGTRNLSKDSRIYALAMHARWSMAIALFTSSSV